MIFVTATTDMAPVTPSMNQSAFRFGCEDYELSPVNYGQPEDMVITETPVTQPTTTDDGTPDTMSLPTPDEWDYNAACRFKKLAVKEARNELTHEEVAELNVLAISRRRSVMRQSTIEQMRFEYERRMQVQNVLKAFNEYFRLITPSGCSE